MARSAWRMPGYRVEELLGAGASGEVWRGRVTSTGIAVALKRIWLADRAQRKAALTEAAMLSALDHPHLMKLHDVRHVDDDIVLVLDLAGGGSLAALLARRGRLTVGEVITAMAPIGAALAYAHSAGVVHGDVSAANVLFTDIGLPLLGDLGVARLLGDSVPVRTTPSYADPTVASGGMPGRQSDVFMLGGVTFHALTGEPPWPGTVPAEVLEAAANGREPDFADRLARAGVPDEVSAVVTRALSIEPARRGSAADFALELRHAAEPVGVELAAGRVRRLSEAISASGGGARAAELQSWPLQSVPAASSASASARVETPPFAPEPPLTQGVRAPSPFRDGRHGGHGRHLATHLARGRPRVSTVVALAATLAVLVVVDALVWWPGGEPGSQVAAPSASEVRATRTAAPGTAATGTAATGAAATATAATGTAATETSAHPPPPSATGTSAVPVGPPTAASMSAALARLDALRSPAFARRAPALLDGVYDSAALVARDRALLLAIVPAGCGLRGLHTQFTGVTVVQAASATTRIRVSARVAPSVLVCGGARSGRAAGTPATALLVDLVRVGGDFRIAAQHTVS